MKWVVAALATIALLAIVAVALLAMRRCRSRLTTYELLVLAVTFVGAVQAVRGVIWFALKVFFMFFLIAMAKAIVPRYRYDQLMRLGWKVFLPLSLAMVVIVAGVLQFAGIAPK